MSFTTERLTGSSRFRPLKPLLRKPKLVLQVEVQCVEVEVDGTEDVFYSYWRDATVEDMSLDLPDDRHKSNT